MNNYNQKTPTNQSISDEEILEWSSSRAIAAVFGVHLDKRIMRNLKVTDFKKHGVE